MANHSLRANSFMIVLYPDDERYVYYDECIRKNFDFLGILHDRDIDSEGNSKKAHFHYVIRSARGALPLSSVVRLTSIPANYIEPLNNYKKGLIYLVHGDCPDKFQYDVSNCFGTLINDLKKALVVDNKSESEKVCVLLDYINSCYTLVSVSDFAHYCASNDMWDIFRRAGSIFIKVIDEHNRHISMVMHNKSLD